MCLRLISIALAIVTSLFAVSCESNDASQSPPSQEGNIGSMPFLLLSESGLSLTDSVLKGTGSAMAKNPLGEIKDDKNIAITFAMEDGGSVSVKMFAGKSNGGALAFKFIRKEKVLLAKLDAAGKSVDVSRNFVSLDASADVSLLIDVHNAETPAHILAWKGGIEDPNETNALFNSEKASDGESPGNGAGTFLGLTISQAVVKKVTVSKAKFEHE